MGVIFQMISVTELTQYCYSSYSPPASLPGYLQVTEPPHRCQGESPRGGLMQ